MKLKELNYERYILSTRPTLWLPFYRDGGGSTIVSSDGYGHVCTVTGTTWGQQGRTFDPTDDMIKPSDQTFMGGTPKSLVVWARSDNAQNDSAIHDIFEAHLVAGNHTITLGKYSNNVFYAGFYHDVVTTERVELASGTFNEIANTWTMFTLLMPVASPCQLYFNTTLKGSASTNPTTFVSDNIEIGRGSAGWGATSSWNGLIGDFLIYNRVLTATEIAQIYRATKWRY